MIQDSNKQTRLTPMDELYKSNTPTLTVEKAIIKAGNAHTYQKRLILLFGVQWMLCSMVFGVNNYLFSPPIIVCSNPETPKFFCNEEQACSGQYQIFFDQSSPSSLATEFSLICGDASYINLGESAIFFGGIVGSIYYADIQTRKGRLFTLIQAISLAAFAAMGSVLSFHILFNIVSLFFINYGTFAFMNTSIPFLMEITSENLRILGPLLLLAFWAIGQIVLSLVMTITTSWRFISFGVLGIPFLVTAFFFKFVKDSPRYLVHLRRFGEAKISIANMAKINQRPLPEYVLAEEHTDLMSYSPGNDVGLLEDGKENRLKPKTFFTLFKYNSLKMPCWALCAFYVLLQIPNQGNLEAFTHFSQSPAQSDLTCGIIELFAYLACAYCCFNFRRKMILKTVFVTVGTIYILFFLGGTASNQIDVHKSGGLALLLLIIARFMTSVGYGTLMVYISEVVPTSVRHFAYALYAAVTCFTYIFLDQFITSMSSTGFRPQILIGAAIISLWFLVTYVPETLDKPLKEEIPEEDEYFVDV